LIGAVSDRPDFFAFRASAPVSMQRFVGRSTAARFRQCRHCGGGPDRAECRMARHRIGTDQLRLLARREGAYRVTNFAVMNFSFMNDPVTN
jgi:hypothetical protein